jgi:hypothetical protein
MARRNFRFNLYTIHGHLEDGVPDYNKLFRSMISLKGHHHEEGKRQVAIGTARLTGNDLFLVVYSGDKEKNLLFFDLEQQQEFNQSTIPTQFQARKTRVVIAPERRQMLIEVGRGKVSADEVADVIEAEAQKTPEFKTLELIFTPVAAEEFITGIDNMSRIQSATVTLARPNVDWTDSYDSLKSMAEASDAKAIDATVRAKRGSGISKEKGLIAAIKVWVQDNMSSVYGAKIKGEKPGHRGLITLNLADHVQRADITVDVALDKEEPPDEVLEQRMRAYLEGEGKGNA